MISYETFQSQAALDHVEIIAEFNSSVARFMDSFSSDGPVLELKRFHSFQVFYFALSICRQLECSKHQKTCVVAAALFHDIGRFQQYTQYGTFRDEDSINHGELGFQILKTMKWTMSLTRRQRSALFAAVKLHNCRTIPPALDRWVREVVEIVRDADKLDIVRVMLEHLKPQGASNNVITLGLKKDPQKYSQTVYDSLSQGKLAKYSDMVWTNDFVMLLLSWVYDLNTQPARGMFLQQRYVDKLLVCLPEGLLPRSCQDMLVATLST